MASSGRILGWVVMLLVAATELAALAALVFPFSLPNLRVVILLPFVWLLFESAERVAPVEITRDRARVS
jgi:hypothetical protein